MVLINWSVNCVTDRKTWKNVQKNWNLRISLQWKNHNTFTIHLQKQLKHYYLPGNIPSLILVKPENDGVLQLAVVVAVDVMIIVVAAEVAAVLVATEVTGFEVAVTQTADDFDAEECGIGCIIETVFGATEDTEEETTGARGGDGVEGECSIGFVEIRWGDGIVWQTELVSNSKDGNVAPDCTAEVIITELTGEGAKVRALFGGGP